MDAELLKEIADFTSTNSRARLLSFDEADEIRVAVSNQFGFSVNRIWWWENLPETVTSISYSGEEGLVRLAELLAKFSEPLYLFVTDDELPPWPCVVATHYVLIEMLRELRFFEYFIVSATMTWIVFDTHHNTLIVFGGELQCGGVPHLSG